MEEMISFYNYAAIVKNLRGVIHWKEKEKSGERLKWLLSRFRYRNLGVTPLMKGKIPERKNLVVLSYPNECIRMAKDVFSDVLNEMISEILCLSSVYISPVITNSPEDFEDLKLSEVKTSKELTDKDWKLHMRIADYTVLDFYTWAVRQAFTRIKEGKDIGFILKERREKIEKDKKRYWRIGENKGKPFLFYVDVLDVANRENILEKLVATGDDVFAVFGIMAVVIV